VTGTSLAGAGVTLTAFAAEAAALVAALAVVPGDGFGRATRCVPWMVRDLVAHVGMATDRVVTMLDESAPLVAEVDAVGYYQPDHRFSFETNQERVGAASAAGARVAGAESDALVARLDATWRAAWARAAAEPAGRVVRTRHGDAMLLADFLVTRVVELAVHGLDLADALDRRSWLTDAAAEVLVSLLLPSRASVVVDTLGWDRLTLLRKATGRGPVTDTDRERLASAGVANLALG
jgi:uncharacterized protein (TIGR03083 family)